MADSESIEIGSATEGLRAQLLSFGASIFGVQVWEDGEWFELTCSNAAVQDFKLNRAAFGGTCGRFANRIRGGRFSLAGQDYQLACNNGPNSLHGGDAPFHLREWEVVHKADNEVVFSLVSPDGDGGYPGELRVNARYTVKERQLVVVYEATTSAPTVVNLTNHVYWNLDPAGSGSVANHRLQVEADHFMPVDADALVTGEIAPVDGPFDFTQAFDLGKGLESSHDQIRICGGIDHPYLIRGHGLRRALCLDHPATGRSLEIFTNQPAVHVYTGNFIDEPNPGKAGLNLVRHSGIALESENVPDAPNLQGFPSAVLNPGESYQNEICWKFGLIG